MGLNLLDWLLVVLVVAYALSGYWQGFVTGAFATVGLLVGGFLGIWVAPLILGGANPSLGVSLGALFIVILGASLGQALLQYAGARVRERITWQPVRAVDAVGGAALSALAVLLVAWALGYAISGTRIGPVTEQVRELVGARQGQLRAPGVRAQRAAGLQPGRRHGLLPALPRAVLAGADRRRRAWSRAGSGTTPRCSRPRPASSRSAAPTTAAAASRAPASCSTPNRVMTNAHVVAGVDDPEVEIDGGTELARVVLYDPELDIAVLSVDTGNAPILQFDEGDEAEDPVAIVGYPQDGPFDVQPGRIRANPTLRSPGHLRLRHRAPRRVLAARTGAAGQLRRTDHHSGRRRRGRGLRRIGRGLRHRLRPDRRAGRRERRRGSRQRLRGRHRKTARRKTHLRKDLHD